MVKIIKKPIILKKILVTWNWDILVNSNLFEVDNLLLKNLYLTGNLDCNFLDLSKEKIEEKLQLINTIEFTDYLEMVKYLEKNLVNKKYKEIKWVEIFEIFVKNLKDKKIEKASKFNTTSNSIEVSIKVLKDKYILTHNN